MQHVLRYSRRRLTIVAAAGLAALVATMVGMGSFAHASPSAPTITSHPFGSVGGQPVSLYTLNSGNGMTVAITNYGGIVQAINVPDRHGEEANVALGFPNVDGYVTNNTHPSASGTTYFGAIIGRYANRIANGQFTLNGHTYHLPQNNGTNTLHGGPNAFNTKIWSARTITKPTQVSLVLNYTDPNGYNGFPGKVAVQVVYTLNQENALRIDYYANTDAPTVINLTNHTYFNLGGEGSGTVNNQSLQINADHYTPVNANLIPTGVIAPVAGTPLDFRSAKPIGRDINSGFEQLVLAHGFDHNWVLNRTGPGLSLAAQAWDQQSGRMLTTYTTEPGVQFYSGNFLQGELVGTSGRTYRQTDGFTLETQHYPDSPNQPSFPTTVLNPGQTFTSSTIYRFSTFGH